MTTGTSPDAGAAARRWAAQCLGLSENASSAEARRAYLRKLRESDFLPPCSLHRALRILDGKRASVEPDEEWLLEEEGRLRAEVASFAEAFFTLSVSQRRQRWEALLSQCQHVLPLSARLQALKAGLEVENPGLPLDESLRGQLAEHLLQSFPLPPLAQAVCRQAFLRRIEDPAAAADRKAWEKAARYLRAEWPAFAALDGELVRHLAKLRRQLKRRSKMHRCSERNPQAASAGSGKGSSWGWLLVLLGMLIGIFRGATTSSTSPSRRPPTPSFSNPLEDLRSKLPPIDELFDPSKYDVGILSPGGGRVLCFTPRPGSTVTGSNDRQADNGKTVLLGEATLRLLGASREQIDFLFSRAAEKKRLDNTPNPPPQEAGPTPPKRSQGDEARP
jgi:hypothetical protein